MNLVDRIKGMLLDSAERMAEDRRRARDVQSLYTGWIMILAAIGPIALLIAPAASRSQFAIAQYVMALIITFVLALIVDALAPTFGGTKDFVAVAEARRVQRTRRRGSRGSSCCSAARSATCSTLVAAIYACYTFYLGAPVLKKCPSEKAVAYTIVVVLCGIVLAIVLGSRA